MDHQLLNYLVELVLKPGATAAILAVVIWWLNKERERVETKREAERKEYEGQIARAYAVFEEERAESRKELRSRVAYLEKEVEICRNDRAQIHEKLRLLEEHQARN